MVGRHCGNLVEKTAAALNEETVLLMLLAVQRGNVELSVKLAWQQWVHQLIWKSEQGSEQKIVVFKDLPLLRWRM